MTNAASCTADRMAPVRAINPLKAKADWQFRRAWLAYVLQKKNMVVETCGREPSKTLKSYTQNQFLSEIVCFGGLVHFFLAKREDCEVFFVQCGVLVQQIDLI